MASSNNCFRVSKKDSGGKTVVIIEGDVDQHADMSLIGEAESAIVDVNLKGIRHLNSLGIYPWITAMEKFTENKKVRFVHCPAVVLDQLAIEPRFLGSGLVESFYGPMVCHNCGEDFTQFFEVSTCQIFGGKIPPITCPFCAHVTEPDDLEEKYEFILVRRREETKA